MDFWLKRDNLALDRLSSLPIELLIRILSLLPTKDAVVTCALSSRIRRAFPWITSLDLSDSPVSNCLQHPYTIHRFPTFVNFVDTVLHTHQSRYLTSFKLQLGKDFAATYYVTSKHTPYGCVKGCFPNLKSKQINAWITFPLTCIGLKELDLRIHVREPGELPPDIFMCETLEVLKLDVNLGLDQVCSMSSFRLPRLKLLHLHASLINEDGFLSRLVSSCPVLEDLKVDAFWNHVKYTRISSPSLRRLCLDMAKLDTYDSTDFVLIDAPNLEYLYYLDNLPIQHSITNMDRLIEAHLTIGNSIMVPTPPTHPGSRQVMLSLIRVFNNVQHLSLRGVWTEELSFGGVKDKLPVFDKLKYLELGFSEFNTWNKVLVPFLNRSPVLATLVFPNGLICCCNGTDRFCDLKKTIKEEEFFEKNLAVIPSCCRSHLKRIVIGSYFGKKRELYVIRFLLRHAFVLEELILRRGRDYYVPVSDQMTLQRAVQSLPRASAKCTIWVQDSQLDTI